MHERRLFTGLLFLVAVLTEAAIALSHSRQGSVTVLAHGPAGLRIEGKSADVFLEEDASALTFKVPIAPINTGIGLRDRHLREMLEAERFPDAILRVARSQLTFPKESEPAEGTARGDLTLHGQSRPVDVRYHAELGADGNTRVRGSMQLDLRDFEIKPPSYLGVTVAPQVEVDAELAVDGT